MDCSPRTTITSTSVAVVDGLLRIAGVEAVAVMKDAIAIDRASITIATNASQKPRLATVAVDPRTIE